MGRLEGKAAFITGAASGIGRAAAALFAAHGAKVAIADIDRARGEECAREVQDAGGEAIFVATDVTSPEQVVAALERAAAAFGKLDVLYNNAGGATAADGSVTEASDEEFWRAIGVDLYGTFLVCKHGIPRLIEANGGSVINTSSNVALKALPGRDCYTAAKGGVIALSRSMAAEYARHRIRVNVIAPGATLTERVKRLMQADPNLQTVAEKHLLGLCEPRHVAQAALYLASDESAVTTGQVIPIDSGMTIV